MTTSDEINEVSKGDAAKYDIKESIVDEVKRQFGETLRRSDAIDTKIGLILGFIFITIGLAINKDLLVLVFQSPPLVILVFWEGFGLIVVSIFSGILAIFFRTFQFGPNMDEVYTKYNDKPEEHAKGAIAGKLKQDTKANLNAIDTKVLFAKVMLITFSIGLVAIIILEIGCFGKMW